MKCLRCNEEMKQNDTQYSLMEAKLDKSTGVVTHNAKVIFPVKPNLCPKCGYVEFTYSMLDELPK